MISRGAWKVVTELIFFKLWLADHKLELYSSLQIGISTREVFLKETGFSDHSWTTYELRRFFFSLVQAAYNHLLISTKRKLSYNFPCTSWDHSKTQKLDRTLQPTAGEENYKSFGWYSQSTSIRIGCIRPKTVMQPAAGKENLGVKLYCL